MVGRWKVFSIFGIPDRAFFIGSSSMLSAKELWQTKAPARVKFFFWTALHRRLWTAARRKRHGLQDDDACVLCQQEPETGDHLFLGCVFVRELWYMLLDLVGLDAMVQTQDAELPAWWIRQRVQLQPQCRHAFDSLLLLVAWMVWKERNNRTFQRSSLGTHELFRRVVREAEDWVQSGFRSLAGAIPFWFLCNRTLFGSSS